MVVPGAPELRSTDTGALIVNAPVLTEKVIVVSGSPSDYSEYMNTDSESQTVGALRESAIWRWRRCVLVMSASCLEAYSHIRP